MNYKAEVKKDREREREREKEREILDNKHTMFVYVRYSSVLFSY